MKQHNIRHRKFTPYHPQVDGQVAVANKSLEGIFGKFFDKNKKDLETIILEATWAYNTACKNITKFTPFELFYGRKELLSIEFEYNTLRME